MKTDKKSLIIFFVVIFFIAGCDSTTQKKEIDVRIGFNGLLVEFFKNTPPQRVFEGDIVPVAIRLKNDGAYSITLNEAILALGVEKDYTRKVEMLPTGSVGYSGGNLATFNLEGKSRINPIGEELLLSYNIHTGKVDPQSEFHSSAVLANLCYPYETVFSSTICVDTDVVGLRPGKKVCKSQDIVHSNGQGAPIAVTKVEISMLPTDLNQDSQARKIKPQFLILIENKGKGNPVKREATMDFCTRRDETSINFHDNLNRVKVNAFLSNIELDCTPKEKTNGIITNGIISTKKYAMAKLKDNKELIRCTLTDGLDASQDSYLSPFTIILTYGYSQSISANYLIQKAAR